MSETLIWESSDELVGCRFAYLVVVASNQRYRLTGHARCSINPLLITATANDFFFAEILNNCDSRLVMSETIKTVSAYGYNNTSQACFLFV